ncbi:hypothetical protein ACFPTO_03850 [Paraburkholderia denitrificans]|uniref:Uncharacterized protein n=1 Tax=Paraburkholderia denitrificans TaxID=694025 RepID=A0ABW0J4L9_9BURK
MNTNSNVAIAGEDPWTLYDFDKDGLEVFDGQNCDYYLLCYTDGALDNGVVLKASGAGRSGLFAECDASGAFGMARIDPRSVAAYVEVRRPEFTDEVMVALARSRKKVVFWYGGQLVGSVETRRPRDQLNELYGRPFEISDGNLTVFECDQDEAPEEAYWVEETLVVTPLRIDVSVVPTSERIAQVEKVAQQRRVDSEARAIKKCEKKTRRANEARLLELGTIFDEAAAMAALAPHAATFSPFGLQLEYEGYVKRITEKHFPSFVATAAADPDGVPAACVAAQVAFDEKCRHKISMMLAKVPPLQQREKTRAEFEGRTGLKLIFAGEVSQLVSGSNVIARTIREEARSWLTPYGNQKLYALEDVEREVAKRRQLAYD